MGEEEMSAMNFSKWWWVLLLAIPLAVVIALYIIVPKMWGE
jgi:hypothetical protein